MTDNSRTRDREVAALLAELEDAGGRVSEGRVDSASLRGTVGSTNVLDEQLSHGGGRRLSSALAGRRHGPGTPPPPRTPILAGGANTSNAAAFSTYAAVPDLGGESGGRAPTQLGVRLAPLQPVGSVGSMGSADAPVGLKPAPPPPRHAGGVKTPMSTTTPTISPFRPLPALTGGRVGAALAKMEAPKEDITIHDHKKFVEQEARQKDSGKVAANAHPIHRPNSGAPSSSDNGAALSEDRESKAGAAMSPSGGADGTYRQTNFLPLMCARYLRPAGLTPSSRWGHTFTAVDETHLFAFGGVEQSGEASNMLCEFNASSIAWEPAFVAKGTPPSARHGHTACAYEGRYLIIYGGVATRGSQLLNDMHMYDTYTQTWTCVWDGRQYNKHEPAARFGHSMVLFDDRLYVYGGRTLKPNGKEGTTLANADVFVFSLNSRRWKHRMTTSRSQKAKPETTAVETEQPEEKASGSRVIMRGDAREKLKLEKFQQGGPVNPVPRSHHAACVLGEVMYVHGGEGGGAAVLTDTWCLHLPTGAWSCLHTGLGADAVPREKHALFACGEALLVVGGCHGAKGLTDRLASKFNNFVAVLPVVGQEVPCWVPVSMGNASIVAPSRKSFGAALHGGFVYLFGGVSGAEPATNSTVRFLAADGYVSVDARATEVANAEAMRGVMQKLRDRAVVPCDMFAAASTLGSAVSLENCVGFHRALLQQRAPLFLEKLLQCRGEPLGEGSAVSGAGAIGAGMPTASALRMGARGSGQADASVVDALMQQLNPTQATSATSPVVRQESSSGKNHVSAARPQVYYTLGNSRVQGLEPALTGEELSALADYLTWGGLRSEYRLLLEDVEDTAEDARTADGEEKLASGMGSQRERLTTTLKGLQRAAGAFALDPLAQLCDALLAGSRKKLSVARKACTATLRADLLALSESAAGATMTVLFADPHTKQQMAQALHPAILMSSSSFFADLLRPLFTGDKSSFQIGTIAAKATLPAASTAAATVNQLVTTSSKRAILVGPISVPTRAVPPLVRFLYTQQLCVPREAALDTLLGAHELALPELQAFSESIVAREEVNFDNCCAFYYLARKYNAALLEEMCLLTAVAGYAEVRHSGSYLGLSPEDRQSIDAVATELRSNTWVNAPSAKTELKSAEAYAARWNNSAAS